MSLFNFKNSPDFEESREPRGSARFFSSQNSADKMECDAGVFPHCQFSFENLLIMIQRLWLLCMLINTAEQSVRTQNKILPKLAELYHWHLAITFVVSASTAFTSARLFSLVFIFVLFADTKNTLIPNSWNNSTALFSSLLLHGIAHKETQKW